MNYGWCDLCHRAVWITWVKGIFPSGEPYGLCSKCGPDSPEKPSEAARTVLSLVPTPSL